MKRTDARRHDRFGAKAGNLFAAVKYCEAELDHVDDHLELLQKASREVMIGADIPVALSPALLEDASF